jgi:hypothetical protein
MLVIGCSPVGLDMRPVLSCWSRTAAGKSPDLRSHFTTLAGGRPHHAGQWRSWAICSYSAAACSGLSGSNHSGFG